MKLFDLAYLPGTQQAGKQPLSRFMPPVPPDIARDWLTANLSGGSWVLDPFSSYPAMIVDAARAGYRILAAANNPITSFMIETMAAAPSSADLQAALADLATVRKGDERLEPHIRSLYSIECPGCKQNIQAEAFIWQRDTQKPYACLIECPNCGEKGERPVSGDNLERLDAIGRGWLHRARALERVISLEDPIRMHVEQALSCYLPRPIYALVTMINRLESLQIGPDRMKFASALLLSACDEANTLWPYPTTRQRPRQLYIPATFRENNLWQALEAAIEEWHSPGPPVPLAIWPELPPEGGGICLYKGRVRDLPVEGQSIKFDAVLSVFPRPNQAFWTLSAVWAGWLWGREAAAPLKSSLSRQRYDWNWHAMALESTLASLQPHLRPGMPMFGLVGEVEPTFILSALIAAREAHFRIQGAAIRTDQSISQFQWSVSSQQPLLSDTGISDLEIMRAIREQLENRSEPAPYLSLFTGFAVSKVAAGGSHATETGGNKPPEADSPTRMLADIHTFFAANART